MHNLGSESSNISSLVFLFLITLMFLGEAWVNIINKRISTFSVDALILFLVQRIGTKKTKANARSFPRNKTEIIVLGICALYAGLKGVQEILIWLNNYNR